MNGLNLNLNRVEKHIITKVPTVLKNSTVKDVLVMLERESDVYEGVGYIYVVDDKNKLCGVFSIKELFNNKKDQPISTFMEKKLITVSCKTEIEKVAHLALNHNLKQIPVTKAKKLIGVVPARNILFEINKSLQEDIFHFAGVHKSHLEFKNTLETPVLVILRSRVPWLIIGLLGAILMAAFIQNFEETLSLYILVAAFIPTIVYISDALANQTLTIFIRDLAIMGQAINIKSYFFRQMFISLIISSILAVIMFGIVTVLWDIPYMSFVISLAAFASLLTTTLIAIVIAILIKRFKFDPAIGSGPIATVIADLTSIVIYFVIVILLL
jgi:magnesium transporter